MTLSDTGLQRRKTVNTASVNYEQTANNQSILFSTWPKDHGGEEQLKGKTG